MASVMRASTPRSVFCPESIAMPGLCEFVIKKTLQNEWKRGCKAYRLTCYTAVSNNEGF